MNFPSANSRPQPPIVVYEQGCPTPFPPWKWRCEQYTYLSDYEGYIIHRTAVFSSLLCILFKTGAKRS